MIVRESGVASLSFHVPDSQTYTNAQTLTHLFSGTYGSVLFSHRTFPSSQLDSQSVLLSSCNSIKLRNIFNNELFVSFAKILFAKKVKTTFKIWWSCDMQIESLTWNIFMSINSKARAIKSNQEIYVSRWIENCLQRRRRWTMRKCRIIWRQISRKKFVTTLCNEDNVSAQRSWSVW